jgi:very-short-patch-repair endonuclease
VKPEAQKLVQIFKFLREFERVKNPQSYVIDDSQISFFIDEIPQHPTIQVTFGNVEDGSGDGDYLLKATRPKLTPPPAVPHELQEWLLSRWDDPFKESVWRESINRDKNGDFDFTERFEEVPDRVIQRDAWSSQWHAWSEAEKPNRRADDFFKQLYSMYGILKQESELILGDGILNRAADPKIYHPILLQRLSVEFDPEKPELIIRETDSPVELNTALLWALESKDIDQIRESNRELGEHAISLQDRKLTAAFLQRLAHGAVSNGRFCPNRQLEGGDGDPSSVLIHQAPVIFVRKRVGGFSQALERILADIPQRLSLSPSLLQICGLANPNIQPDDRAPEAEDPSTYYGNERKDILFTKPANREQIRIVERLNRHGTVLVQGPPGTGKSHTIGNLIGHLLAEGKRILVTAETAKALQVVRGQVVEDLQPLCVSVLDDDLKSRDELEKSVTAVLEKLNSYDAAQLRREAKRLSAERDRLLEELAEARKKALEARTNEYRSITVAGKDFLPTEAAKLINAGVGACDWIPGPVEFGSPIPLSVGEVEELYSSNIQLTEEEEREISKRSPNTSDLLDPEAFADLINRSTGADLAKEEKSVGVWVQDGDPGHLKELQSLLDQVDGLRLRLGNFPHWSFVIVSDCVSSDAAREKWTDLADLIMEVHNDASSFQAASLEHAPEVLEESDDLGLEHLLIISGEIANHLSKRGSISPLAAFSKPKWKLFIRRCRTNGKEPRRQDEFRAIDQLLRIKQARQKLETRWTRLMEAIEDPPVTTFGSEPEAILINLVDDIRTRSDWKRSNLDPFIERLSKLGLNWDVFLAEVPPQYHKHGFAIRLAEALQKLPSVLEARAKTIKKQAARSELGKLSAKTISYLRDSNASVFAKELSRAIEARNATLYREHFDCLVELQRKKSIRDRRLFLLEKLRKIAPGWAETIATRRPPHDQMNTPGDIEQAWLWTQLGTALDERSNDVEGEIERKVDGLVKKLFDVTALAVDALAWSSQIEHVEKNQKAKMALQGWLQTVKRMGKGKGKMAPMLKLAAKKEMESAREAVPVWIMPLQRVLENFDATTAKFDVIIIDEASQCDMLGLVPLYMSQQIIVVGDHEQVSPEAVAEKSEELGRLVTTFLEGIPQAQLYSGKQSIYELAQRAFSGRIMLREHFRSDPKIISFSNRLCYGGQIVPLRETSRLRINPPLVAHRVEGAANKKTNEEEATTIASLIAAALEQTEYQINSVGEPVSIGVIAMVGTDQPEAIRRLIFEKIEPRVIERHRIVCGSPREFQGDERDLIFVSMVDSLSDEGTLRIRTEDRFKQRFNVAASRARDQMWVVYSLDPSVDLKSGDLRRLLIEHAINPDAVERKIEDSIRLAESEFERRVLTRLVGEGYSVIPQYQVGRHRIDLVVTDGANRLAVELDGEQSHPPSQLAADMERQAMLERAGWRFVRIRGSKFFRDEVSALGPLYETFRRFGIAPRRQDSLGPTDDSELINRVRRRAIEIKREWQEMKYQPQKTLLVQKRESFQRVSNRPVSVGLVNGLSEQSVSFEDRRRVIGGPITLAKLAEAKGITAQEMERIAWREAFFAGRQDEPIPSKDAQKIAKHLQIQIEDPR